MMDQVLANWKDIEFKLEKDQNFRDGIRKQENKELTEILEYTIANTPYYAGIKEPILNQFPVVDKRILNECYDNIFVKAYADKDVHKMHTSGSTGTPFTVIQNMEKRSRHLADLKYFGELAGYKDHTSLCFFKTIIASTPEQMAEQNIWQLNITNPNEENFVKHYHTILEKKCVAILTYGSSIDTAVRVWAKRFPKNETNIKTIITISEALAPETRERLVAYFGRDVKIRSRYSNQENGIMGQENEIQGRFVLNWASYYFEVLKFDCDEPCEDGELGRIVVTDLYNKAFPMIRYDTGDVAKIIHPREGFPYFVDLMGRRMDLIYDTKHEVLNPFVVYNIMKMSDGIEQWQFIQETEKSYLIKIVATKGNEQMSHKNEIEKLLFKIGEDANIHIEYVNEIPTLKSLKRKLIVSALHETKGMHS